MDAEKAREEAAQILRFEIGTIPHLGDHRYSEEADAYVFPVKVSYPRLPDDPHNPDDELEFDDPVMVGEIVVAEDGDPRHTPTDVINARVGQIKNGNPPA